MPAGGRIPPPTDLDLLNNHFCILNSARHANTHNSSYWFLEFSSSFLFLCTPTLPAASGQCQIRYLYKKRMPSTLKCACCKIYTSRNPKCVPYATPFYSFDRFSLHFVMLLTYCHCDEVAIWLRSDVILQFRRLLFGFSDPWIYANDEIVVRVPTAPALLEFSVVFLMSRIGVVIEANEHTRRYPKMMVAMAATMMNQQKNKQIISHR